MDCKDLVSIVIPVYNREKLISDAIDSALNQTYNNIEIVIGDNNSTDSTWDIIQNYAQQYPQIKAFRNKENVGPVLNWVECFKRCEGKYIKVIFSDDLISSNYIEEALRLFDNETAFVISKIGSFYKLGKITDWRYYNSKEYMSDQFVRDRIIGGIYDFSISPGYALLRKSDVMENFVIDIPNPSNLDSKKNGAGNDSLLLLLIASKYKKIRVARLASAFFRAHPGSFSCSESLVHYYEWAKIYFINKTNLKRNGELLNIYFYLKSRKDKNYQLEYEAVPIKFKNIKFTRKIGYTLNIIYCNVYWKVHHKLRLFIKWLNRQKTN